MGDIFVVYIFKTQCYVLTNGGDDLRGDETVAIGALKNTNKFYKGANFRLDTEWYGELTIGQSSRTPFWTMEVVPPSVRNR